MATPRPDSENYTVMAQMNLAAIAELTGQIDRRREELRRLVDERDDLIRDARKLRTPYSQITGASNLSRERLSAINAGKKSRSLRETEA